MRHALISTKLLHQAREAAIARAEAHERLEQQAQAKAKATHPTRRSRTVYSGRHPGPTRPRPGDTDPLTAARRNRCGCDTPMGPGSSAAMPWPRWSATATRSGQSACADQPRVHRLGGSI